MTKHVVQITALDLDKWADCLDSAAKLPVLVRRLIHATTNVKSIDFPAHEDVRLPGWDGVVESLHGSPFVPPGQSVWEVSGESGVGRKASRDYTKRSKDPEGYHPGTSTFVFVSLRKWRGKKKWREQRQAEGVWAEIRAYDASDLEQWIETAPSVELWLSAALGRPREDFETLSEFWDRWAGVTEPPFSAAMMLAGREDAAARVRKWLAAPPSPLVLQADSRNEATAFLAAILVGQAPERADAFLSRGVVATSREAVAAVATSLRPLIIVAATEEDEPLPSSAAAHHVLVPLDPTVRSEEVTVLPRLGSEELQRALRAAGLSERVAEDIVHKVGGRVAPLRRRLSHPTTPRVAPWSDRSVATSLVPVLLAGAWDEASPADVEAVAGLARQPYDDVSALLVRWLNVPDPPFRRHGSIWRWVSRADAWWLLVSFIGKSHLDAFEVVAVSVLGAKDPKFELPPDERWQAAIRGKARPHSGQLRQALADGLALLASVAESRKIQDAERPEDRARRVVRSLLATDDAEQWASLADVLPTLAEAAPTDFLDAVDRFSAGDKPPGLGVFAEEKGFLGSDRHHTGLLWALEALAWDPQRLPRVTILLGRLARLDPGGSLANRPAATLRHIFLGWYPQTSGSFELRLDALDALLAREPAVGWNTLLDLLPALGGDHSWPLYRPRWRPWHEAWHEGVSHAEYVRHLDAVMDRVAQNVGNDLTRWVVVLEKLNQFSSRHRVQFLERLEGFAETGLDVEAGVLLWHSLRKQLYRYRRFEDAGWALPRPELERLARVFAQLTPNEPVSRFGWLYAWHPAIPDPPQRDDCQAEKDTANHLRADATAALLRANDPGLLLALAGEVEEPRTLGASVGGEKLSIAQERSILAAALDDRARETTRQFLEAFVGARVGTQGWSWAEEVLADRPDVDQALLAFGLPFDSRTWDLLLRVGADAENAYWAQVRPWPLTDVATDGERALRRLLAARRPWAALVIAEDCIEQVGSRLLAPAPLIGDVLEQAMRSDPGEDGPYAHRQHGHDVGQLLDALDGDGSVDEGRLGRIEWLWLPALSYSERRQPRILHRLLGRDPAFFAEVVSFIWRPESERTSESRPPATPEEVDRAKRAQDLLYHWTRIPGHKEDGTVDRRQLLAWVRAARQECGDRDRAGIGDDQIGRLLSHAPGDVDGAWPAIVVREIVEEVASADLDDGLRVGRLNSRGVTTRGVAEGGGQERSLAQQYRDWATASTRWPRMARILESLAEAYEAQAQSWDIRMERDDT